MDLSDVRQVIKLLADNYSCLHSMYRGGKFEDSVGVVDEVSSGDSRKFYVLNCQGNTEATTWVMFKDAVANFYRLIEYVGGQRAFVYQNAGPLILRSKCLIYEAYDYQGWIPIELEQYFINLTEVFLSRSNPKEMEDWADEINNYEEYGSPDQKTGAIKYLLIAALLGVNSHIRRHSDYRNALDKLDRIYKYAVVKLPQQHVEQRESYGVMALSLYLKGRALLALGSFAQSRVAFAQSTEAYVNRVRQKEQFWDTNPKKIKSEAEFRDKVSVTLRRAALVTAFGDGYLSYINSEITRALESLTLARAALSQNSGRIFLAFVDMRILACKRALHSSDRVEIEKVVTGLESCHATLERLAGDTRYYLRCSVELSLALYYKSKFASPDSGSSYKRAKELLEGVINEVEEDRDGESKNPHLLSDARIYKSYLLRSRFRSHRRAEQQAHIDELKEAIDEATKACTVADKHGTALLRSEAHAALGAAYTDMIVFLQKRQKQQKDFFNEFGKAFQALQTSLRENAENVRLEAASYLRLTRLCLLNENTTVMGHEYFEQWRRLENKVEHAYLKEIAADIEKQLGSPYYLVKPGKMLEINGEPNRVFAFMQEVAINRVAMNLLRTSYGRNINDKALRRELENFLKANTDIPDTSVRRIVDNYGLLDKLKKLIRDLQSSPE
jgi:hypothetical protein